MSPTGYEYENDEGEPGTLSGKTEASIAKTTAAPKSWAERRHPLRATLVDDERRQRASFIATRKILADYLVPHRFEGAADGSKLRRSLLGYGVALNRGYLQEVLGHVRGAPAVYDWGPMSDDEGPTSSDPVGGSAALLWSDVNRAGMTWRNFFERRVLEWLLTSVGGWILVDAVAIDGEAEFESKADEDAAGLRPFLEFVPVSWAEDWGRGDLGYRWIKLSEATDKREPKDEEDAGYEVSHLLYELEDSGSTTAARYDDEGKAIDEAINVGELKDRQGSPTLPFVAVAYGEHPEVPYFGAGLLMGLDDIVIDLYNLQSEIREGYRDVSFGIIVHKGGDSDKVQSFLEQGSRFVSLGDDGDASLSRLAAESAEVQAGLSLLETGLTQWALSAKRKAAEATDRATAKSGIALQAEFQLDLKPLLVEVVETLDAIETSAMHLVGQLAGHTAEELKDVGVVRSTEFRLEDEVSRISRILAEYLDVLPLPASATARIALAWLEKSELLDLDEEVERGGEGTVTLREALEIELERLATAKDLEVTRPAEFGGGFGI